MKQISKMKRVLALCLVFSLILGFAACGRTGGDNSQGPDQGPVTLTDYAYLAQFIDIDAPSVTNLRIIGIQGDRIFVHFHPANMWESNMPEDGEMPSTREEALRPWSGIGSIRTDGTDFTVLWQGQGGTWQISENETAWHAEDIGNASLTESGSIIAIRSESTSGENFSFEENYFLMEIAPDGRVLREVDLISQLNFSQNDFWSLSGLETLSDGTVLFGLHDGLIVINPDFSFRTRFSWDVSGFAVTANDEILVSQWGQEWLEAYVWKFDLETGQILDDGDSLFDVHLNNTNKGISHDLYISGDRGMLAFDMETGTLTQLFTWMELDLLHGGLAVPAENGDMFFVEQQWDTNQASLVRLQRVDRASIPVRQTLVYGALTVSWETRQEIIEFNRRSQTHRIEIREYHDWLSGETREDAIRRLNTDMISGNAPDILEITQLPFETYARRGFLADLGAKIDNDPSINRGDFVENLMRLMEVEGNLFTVASSFSVRTVVGASQRVGNQMGWTMEEFQAAVGPVVNAGGTAFGEMATRQTFLQSVLSANMGQFIDRETSTTNFDSDLFRAYLEFASTLPTEEELWGDDWNTPGGWARPLPMRAVAEGEIQEYSYIEIEPPMIDIFPPGGWENPHATGQALLAEQTIWGMTDIVWAEELFEGSVTFIGYPTEGGTGSVISPRLMLAISAQSQHQDVAWEFVRTILTEEFQRANNFNFPSNLRVLEEVATISLRDQETLGEEDRWANVWQQLTQSQVDQVMQLINNADQLEVEDALVIEMILEELPPFFAGDRSVEETARIIQSRVQLYVSERG